MYCFIFVPKIYLTVGFLLWNGPCTILKLLGVCACTEWILTCLDIIMEKHFCFVPSFPMSNFLTSRIHLCLQLIKYFYPIVHYCVWIDSYNPCDIESISMILYLYMQQTNNISYGKLKNKKNA